MQQVCDVEAQAACSKSGLHGECCVQAVSSLCSAPEEVDLSDTTEH